VSVVKATFEWYGQTDVDPAISYVYLQIYNYNTDEWEVIDQVSDSYASDITDYADEYAYYVSPGANTDFSLLDDIDDLTNYLGPGNIVTCRVYQLDPNAPT